MDVSGAKGSRSMDLNSKENSDSMLESGSQKKVLKSCADCKTTRTPLWRSGPTGPKSLCNACGIRYTKKRREMVGAKENKKKEKMRDDAKEVNIAMKFQIPGNSGNDDILRRRLISSSSSWLQRKLGEEEQAAVLLMALSCGFR